MTRLVTLSLLASIGIAADFDWKLPPGFPRPVVPRDNSMTAAKVELGRHLFYEKRMSRNGTQSCGTCHRQELAFTDGKARAIGSTGERHPRGSMSLVNVAYVPLLTWANPEVQSLEAQALIPMFGEDPVELGMKGHEAEFLATLRSDAAYRDLFAAAYPAVRDPFSMDNVVKAIASFERTIISARSPYDRYKSGDAEAISESAKRGEKLFFNEKTACAECHGGFAFGGEVRFDGGQEPHIWFFNTGVAASFDPAKATGLQQFTLNRGDIGRFRPPTLRNIAVTAPYMHDGSIATLEEVIDHYAAGGRVAGVANKSPLIHGFRLDGTEKDDLVAFLRCLSDSEALKDARWSAPSHNLRP